MKTLSLIIIAMIITGCASAPRTDRTWTVRDDFFAGFTILGQTLDCTSTIHGLNKGYKETNIILGDDPSNGSVVAVKAAMIGIAFVAAHYLPSQREWILGIVGAGGIAAWAINENRMD